MCFMVVMEDEHNNSDVCQRMCSFKVSLQIKEGTVLMTCECLIRRNIFFQNLRLIHTQEQSHTEVNYLLYKQCSQMTVTDL